jgi:hypothetical protein
MGKYTLLLIILSSLSSWSQSEIDNKDLKTVYKDFTYFTPVFVHKNKNALKTVYDRYEELSQVTLDSLFDTDSKKYKITEKIDYKTSNDSNLIEEEIKQLFKSVNKHKKNFKLNFSQKLKSVINKSSNNYTVFMSINTRGRYASETGPIIYETRLKYIIIDFKKNNIVFYGKSNNSETINGGYEMTLIKNLNKIYKKIKKQLVTTPIK